MKIPIEAEGFLNDASYYFEIPQAIQNNINSPNSISEIKVHLYEKFSHSKINDGKKLIDFNPENSSFVINLSGRKYNKGKTSPEEIFKNLIFAIKRINKEYPDLFKSDQTDKEEDSSK